MGDDSPRQRPPAASEASLAKLLATTLEDEGLWAFVEAHPDDAARRDSVADRAVDLYRRTAPVIESRVDHAAPEPIDRAVGALREIADTLAMLSYPWTEAERAALRVPTREVIELGIRLFDVDDWASELGQVLKLGESSVPEEVWGLDETVGAHVSESDLVSHFLAALDSYETVLGLRDLPKGRDFLRRDDVREAACREISGARGWLVWTRGRGHVPEAELVAIVIVQIAQAAFIASRERTSDEGLFPSKVFLRMLFEHSEAYGWITHLGAELPYWLS